LQTISVIVTEKDIYLIKKKRVNVRVDTGCTNCRSDSNCKEDCECRYSF
jgi:hypothetical protein